MSLRALVYNALGTWGCTRSPATLQRVGAFVGTGLWHLVRKRRALTITTIQDRLGVDANEARRIARESFVSSGRSFIEIMQNNRNDPRFFHNHLRIATPQALEYINRFKHENPDVPVVAFTAHFGAWEVLASLFGRVIFHKEPQQVVVRRPRDEALHTLMQRMRTRPGVEFVEHRGATRPVLKCLRKGGITAFLVDHNCTRSEAVFLPFLGRVAAVNAGPAILAVRAGALVLPVFLRRTAHNREHGYELIVRDPLDTRTLQGTRDERVRETARFYTDAVADMVRETPEQWFWMHRRWKTRPAKEDVAASDQNG